MTVKFPCNNCGACCKSVALSHVTEWLNRGDGVCLYFNEATFLCSIYENRPDICRVDVQYKKNYSDNYIWGDFVALNQLACLKLNEQQNLSIKQRETENKTV